MNSLSYIVAYHLFAICFAESDSRVAKAFLESKIVPKIEEQAPDNFITVKYRSASVDLGSRLNPLQTLKQPNISFEAEPDKFYTFEFFGPNLPLDLIPRYKQVLHWLVVNVPGEDLEKGDTVSSYFPPVPYPGGFVYCFLLYEQNGHIDPEPLRRLDKILQRPGFDVVKFKREHSLKGPIAGNFMRQVYLPPITISTKGDRR